MWLQGLLQQMEVRVISPLVENKKSGFLVNSIFRLSVSCHHSLYALGCSLDPELCLSTCMECSFITEEDMRGIELSFRHSLVVHGT
ncbi:hypothetical protein TNCT_317141 [Trichonephila clavata]|uniref:Uncharacterized protein n=1 Tax=Trichonephila clavata TaxID=2740835 RepID=A0A8X6LDA7_TRICU|nr:hypothetical protein TNCT_317141 [Trichonephila clavata]